MMPICNNAIVNMYLVESNEQNVRSKCSEEEKKKSVSPHGYQPL